MDLSLPPLMSPITCRPSISLTLCALYIAARGTPQVTVKQKEKGDQSHPSGKRDRQRDAAGVQCVGEFSPGGEQGSRGGRERGRSAPHAIKTDRRRVRVCVGGRSLSVCVCVCGAAAARGWREEKGEGGSRAML